MNKTTILTLGAISLMNIATASTWNEVFQNGAFVSGGGAVTLSENVSGGSGGILGNTEQGTVSVDLDHKELSFTGEWLPFCVYGGTESALTYFDNGIVMGISDVRRYQLQFGALPSMNGVVAYGQQKMGFNKIKKIVLYQTPKYFRYTL